ncbi:MAG: cation acetate symporter, partial [Candidatus Carbobacillus sp.]|nr:cation acetate symporter [Candidatus Carbobacillus sp.]
MPEPGVISLFLFLTIMAGTLVITHWAAERGRTTVMFYTAARSLTGVQNGLAIAGDYISAASFLGTTGAIALFGYDGFLYSIGFLASYVFLLLWIAEPVHRLGFFSLGDVFYARFGDQRLRLMVALFQFFISLMYLVPQLVASGLLLRLLLGLDYGWSVWIIGVLMTIYVTFGGMTATSWVQIIKTVLLLSGTLLLVLIAFARYDWHVMNLFVEAESMLQNDMGKRLSLSSLTKVEASALLLTLFLGTSGLPHILMRFFTVRSVRAVRLSLLTAVSVIGFFYLITLILGFAARVLVGYDRLQALDPTGNLAAPLLAYVLGGTFLVAFV